MPTQSEWTLHNEIHNIREDTRMCSGGCLHTMDSHREIVGDNGPQFIAEDFHEFLYKKGIKHSLTSTVSSGVKKAG